MANTKSDLITAQEAARTALASGVVNGDDAGGKLMRARAVITLPSGVADADTFQICDLPPGAVLSPQDCNVTCSADPGTTLVLDVGYDNSSEGGAQTDADGLADGITLSAGGRIEFTSGAIPDALVNQKRLTHKTRISAVVPSSGANTVTAGVKLIFTIGYIIKG